MVKIGTTWPCSLADDVAALGDGRALGGALATDATNGTTANAAGATGGSLGRAGGGSGRDLGLSLLRSKDGVADRRIDGGTTRAWRQGRTLVTFELLARNP